MTMKLIVNRFRTRRPDGLPEDAAPPSQQPHMQQPHMPQAEAPGAPMAKITPLRMTPAQQAEAQAQQAQLATQAAAAAQAVKRKAIGDDAFISTPEDGFGATKFATARHDAPNPAQDAATGIDAVRREGLTGRQLRMARRLAQKHNLPATSDFDAVRLLRLAGIDPFQANSVLEMVSNAAQSLGAPSTSREVALSGSKLPQTVPPAGLPSVEDRAAESHIAEVRRIQRDIVARRRKKTMALVGRLAIFVGIPTILGAIYFYSVATPFYSTKTEFQIQAADPGTEMQGGALASLGASALATARDAITVQGYLQSQEAMARLDADAGFRAHFSDPKIDAIQRLDPSASNTSAFKTYRKNVKISFDPTEGIVKMEVIAADPETTVAFSKALIGYAEEQVDQLSARLRKDQMAGTEDSYNEAEANLAAANEKVVELQEKYKILSSDIEVGLITTQIGQLEGQLTQDRLSLAQMESNPNPNPSRIEPLRRRIVTLEAEIAKMRARMTENTVDGLSIARVQSELLVAQADVETRRVMLAQVLQARETARAAVGRQTRYLSMSVNPILPDEAAYPRAFENTLVTFLIFAGLYLMLAMTTAILREQITA